METDPEKVKAVETRPVSLNLKELQIFLGLARFISGFSIIAEPLYQLCWKNMSYHWQEEQESAFEDLNRLLVSLPVLAYLVFSHVGVSFILDDGDSQHLRIGAVVSQLQPNGTKRVIAYGSRSLHDHNKNLLLRKLVYANSSVQFYKIGRSLCDSQPACYNLG